MGEKETYLENVDAQINVWRAQIKELRIMAENNYLQEIENLENKYEMVKQKVEEVKSADDET